MGSLVMQVANSGCCLASLSFCMLFLFLPFAGHEDVFIATLPTDLRPGTKSLLESNFVEETVNDSASSVKVLMFKRRNASEENAMKLSGGDSCVHEVGVMLRCGNVDNRRGYS